MKKNNVEEVKKMYPAGTLVELIENKGEAQVPAVLTGTITMVDDIGQVHVNWENGSTSTLDVEEESFTVIPIPDLVPDKISVLYIEPGKTPRLMEIDNTLEAKQKIVGGYIEAYMPFEDEAAIICNEEGKFNGMEPNRAVYNDEGEMIDIIFGPFFICYDPRDSEDFLSLPVELAEKYKTKFKFPEHFYKWDGTIIVEPYNP